MKKQESYMRWAIALALEGQGLTSPNPMVGALIVKNDRIVGEGYHRKAGGPHAEIVALHQTGGRARAADLYVTLEPCAHKGRTPPCVDAIIAAGVRRVIIGTRDPNPMVNGRGIRRLRRAGIAVTVGVLEQNCRSINEAYNAFIVTGKPFVTVKAALSLDGKIAAASGDSRWITNAECRQYVHRLRGQVDAVLVGGGTVRADDPRLTVRLKGWIGHEPRAIIVDEALDLSRKARIWKRARGQVIVATTMAASISRRRWIERQGHAVLICRATADGRVMLSDLMRRLGREGISSVLVEGGGEIFAGFFRSKLVGRLVACMAPKLIGGKGLDFLPGISHATMQKVPSLSDVTMKTFGDNIVVEGRLR